MSNFILVRHDATRRGLHWDLRWREPNSNNWISFAFRKFPPTKSGTREYIIRTTEHSEGDALFLGKIPEGEYGAGTLTEEDSGKCDILKHNNSHMIVVFHGKKLNGKYHIISTGVFGDNRDHNKKSYAFFKSKEDISEDIHPQKMWKDAIAKTKSVGKKAAIGVAVVTLFPMAVKILRYVVRSLNACNRSCETVDIHPSKLSIEDRACVRRCRIGIMQKGIAELTSLKNKCTDKKCNDKIDSKIEILKNRIAAERDELSYLGVKRRKNIKL